MKNIILQIIIITSVSIQSFSQDYGEWIIIDSLSIPRIGHASVVLPNSNVLISGNGVDSASASCAIYDIDSGNWRPTNPMNIPRHDHKMILLDNGKVLAMGGYKETSCELFDHFTEEWVLTDSIPTVRYWGNTVTKLKDGRVLVTGGLNIPDSSMTSEFLDNCEIYNPVTGKWTTVSPLLTARKNHKSVLLSNGEVLVIGGSNNYFLSSCEIYDPIFDKWTNVSEMNKERESHNVILLDNGNVFVSGGWYFYEDIGMVTRKSCEVFYFQDSSWHMVGDLTLPRANHAVFFTNEENRLLILGGGSNNNWEIYDTEIFSPLVLEEYPLKKFIENNAIQLTNKKIMVIGGEEWDIIENLPVSWPSKSCEMFDYITLMERQKVKPHAFRLYQNYPNPFNPSTAIRYYLPQSDYVLINVYTLLGQHVKTLVNSYQILGEHIEYFKNPGLSSGIYIYKLQTNCFSESKKMIIIQ